MTDRIIAVAKLDTDPDSSGMADLRTAYPQLDFIFDRLAELEVRDTLAVALAGEVRGLEDQVLDQQDEIGRLRSIVIGIGTAAAEMAAPVNSLLPKIKSINGISIPKENRPNTIDRVIKRLYQPI